MVEPDNALSIAILREIRSDSRKQLTLFPQLADAVRRHDRRFDEMDRRFNEMAIRLSETGDEIELMVKSELMGRLTHFETQMDARIAQLDDRVRAVENAPN